MHSDLLQMAADLARREEPFVLLPAHNLESLTRLLPLLAA